MAARSFEEKQEEEAAPPPLTPHSTPPPRSLFLYPLQTRYRVDTDFSASVKATAASAGVAAAAAVVTAAEVRRPRASRVAQWFNVTISAGHCRRCQKV